MQKSLQYATLIACLLAVISPLFSSYAAGPLNGLDHYVVPKPPPAGVAFYDEMKKEYTLDDFKGKVVILNFWATWCGYCKLKMPKLDALQQQYPKDLRVLSVSQDFKGPATTLPYMERSGLKLTPYFDHRNSAYRAFGGRSLPYILLIDKNGKVASRIDGLDLESPEFNLYLKGFF